MKALLVRVGVDSSIGGGSWNGPVDTQTGRFAYVAIPETRAVHAGMEKPYSALDSVLPLFGVSLPAHLRARHMHLDPDFDHLTYGDQGERASPNHAPRDAFLHIC
jgi:Nucleotide modification associated domain 3